MFGIVVVSVVIGFALILLLKKTTASIPREKDFYAESDPADDKLKSLGMNQFEGVCGRLLTEWGLVIKSCSRLSPQEIEFVAQDPKPIVGGDFIVYGRLVTDGEVIETSRVMALSDVVRSEKASKGVFITTGFFSADTAQMLEGAPLELINARRLKELILHHDLRSLV